MPFFTDQLFLPRNKELNYHGLMVSFALVNARQLWISSLDEGKRNMPCPGEVINITCSLPDMHRGTIYTRRKPPRHFNATFIIKCTLSSMAYCSKVSIYTASILAVQCFQTAILNGYSHA